MTFPVPAFLNSMIYGYLFDSKVHDFDIHLLLPAQIYAKVATFSRVITPKRKLAF
jgi:hypothetical protein